MAEQYASLNNVGAIWIQHKKDLAEALNFNINSEAESGEEASVSTIYDNNTKDLQFKFVIPKGIDGINGKDGVDGISPIIKFNDQTNRMQVSIDEGKTWSDISDNEIYTKFRTYKNKLQISYDLGNTWEDASEFIASSLRWTSTAGSSQSGSIGKIQISRDNGVTWTDLSDAFINNLHISKYVSSSSNLPSVSSTPLGTICAVGPKSGTNTYTLYVCSEKNATKQWINNGEFTSIAAGVVQELGTSETSVPSVKLLTEELKEDRYHHQFFSIQGKNNEFVEKRIYAIPGHRYKLEILNRDQWTWDNVSLASGGFAFEVYYYIPTADGAGTQVVRPVYSTMEYADGISHVYNFVVGEDMLISNKLRVGLRADALCEVFFSITDTTNDRADLTDVEVNGFKDHTNERIRTGYCINPSNGLPSNPAFSLYGPIYVSGMSKAKVSLYKTNNPGTVKSVASVVFRDKSHKMISYVPILLDESLDLVTSEITEIDIPTSAFYMYVSMRNNLLKDFVCEVSGQTMLDKINELSSLTAGDEIRNGTNANTANTTAVRTTSYVPVREGSITSLEINRPLPEGCTYRFGYAFYDKKYSLDNSSNYIFSQDYTLNSSIVNIPKTKNGKSVNYIRYVISQYDNVNKKYIQLRKGDFEGYQVNVHVAHPEGVIYETIDKIGEIADSGGGGGTPFNADSIFYYNPDYIFGSKFIGMRKTYSKSATGATKNLMLGWFSDIHQGSKPLTRLLDYLGEKGYGKYLDDIIQTGDICSDYLIAENGTLNSIQNYISNAGAQKVLNVIGNHDTAKRIPAPDYYDWDGAGQLTVYNEMIAPFVSAWGVVQPSNASTLGLNYYYKDYVASKIRLIVLDCMFYDDNQNMWLQETLEDAMNNNYSVICASHYTPDEIVQDKENPYCDIAFNFDNVLNLNAVYSVKSFIDNGGKFICWLGGHTHFDNWGVSKIDNRQTIILAACACDPNHSKGGVDREANTKSYDQFNVISFDVHYGYIQIFRIGCDYDRHLKHRGTMCYDYKNKKILSIS